MAKPILSRIKAHQIQIAAHKLHPLLYDYVRKMIDHIDHAGTCCREEICAGMKRHQPSHSYAYHEARVEGYLRILRMMGYAKVRKLPRSHSTSIITGRYYSYTYGPGTVVYTLDTRELRRVQRLAARMSKNHYP